MADLKYFKDPRPGTEKAVMPSGSSHAWLKKPCARSSTVKILHCDTSSMVSAMLRIGYAGVLMSLFTSL